MAGWVLVNARVITERLQGEPEDVRDAVSGAIELLLQNPYEPTGLYVHEDRNRPGEGTYIAHLPADWYLRYRPRRMSVPPLMGKVVEAQAFLRRVI